MGSLRISKGKDNSLLVQGSNNARSKEKQKVKEKNSKSDNEDEITKRTDEGSMNKFNKEGMSCPHPNETTS